VRLYLDDNLASPLLASLLSKAGHDVQLPAQVGLVGETDPVHLAHSVRNNRTILSENHGDFEDLHDLVMAVQGLHPGILIVRKDNNPKRDLTPPGIVRALRNLISAGVPMLKEFIIWNHWR
jgi:predicted nuclease of predicted toxin-antitoxin system